MSREYSLGLTRYWTGCKSLTVLAGRCWTGSPHICVAVFNTYTHIGGLFYTVGGSVRSTAGIGSRANPIPSVHRWPAAVGEEPPTTSSCLYAVDIQIYGFCRPADSADLCEKVSVCVNEVSAWMASNRRCSWITPKLKFSVHIFRPGSHLGMSLWLDFAVKWLESRLTPDFVTRLDLEFPRLEVDLYDSTMY